MKLNKAGKSESKISLITDQFSKRFVKGIFLLAIAFFVYFGLTQGMEVAFSRTLTLLIITCPCALALTTPMALILGLSNMAKLGVLVKNEHIIEKLAIAKNIFLDKTGTLTHGDFKVTKFTLKRDVEDSLSYYERLIYLLEDRSGHPIATSIVFISFKKTNDRRYFNKRIYGDSGCWS